MQIISGEIVAGMGEGAYFMSMPHYKNEIKNQLGFDAYPGTLNIHTKGDWKKSIKRIAPINLSGYEKDGKFFGGASCYKASIGDIDGAVIIPDLTKHGEDVIEFIAPVHVKTKLNAKDGDKIKLKIK